MTQIPPGESLRIKLRPFFQAAIPERVSELLEPFKQHRRGPIYAYIRRVVSQTHPNVVVNIHRNSVILEYYQDGLMVSDTVPLPGPLAYYRLLHAAGKVSESD